MANWNWFGKLHQRLIRWTGGRFGSRLVGIDMINVHTIGRKTGKSRIVPIACYPCGNDVAVVASNNGQDHHPAWLLNLRAHPQVEVQLGRDRYLAKASEMSSEEKAAFWPTIVAINPRQADYKASSSRDLPVVVFQRV